MLIDPMIIAIFVILVFLFLKVPVFISILSGAVTYFILSPNLPQIILAQRFVAGIESIPLMAVPFFVCAGVFMNHTGITRRIMTFCIALVGRSSGGLAKVNVLLSTLMGGLSGSLLADAAMEAKILVPDMEKNGYSKEFSTVVTSVSAIITPLIPPGICLILYGSLAGISIGKLFIAGLSIGLTLCIILMLFVSFISKRRGYLPIRTERVSSKETWKAFKGAILPLFLPVFIIGGIRIGIFTPTEAGAFAIVYSIFLGLIYKELTIKKLIKGMKETINTTAAIMLIVAAASALSWVFTERQVPQTLATMMAQGISSKWIFLLTVNIFLLFIGMFIEGNAATILLVPLLAPIAVLFNVDPIHFAMIFTFNIAIGAITPPMGTLMFVTCSITECKISKFIRESIPFMLLLLLVLILLTTIPFLSTGLVGLFY